MEFGICKLAVVPLRKEGNDQSEMVSQVLFGEYFKILKIETKWIFIQLARDDYKGWICSKQYQEITYEDYENLSLNEFPKVLNSNATVESLVNKEIIPITTGSTLPFFNKGIIKIRNEKFRFNGEVSSGKTMDIINYARRFINTPYLWGGKTKFGIDCSGFSQLIYSLSGINIPRDASQQEELGKKIAIKNTVPTDLVFFKNEYNKVNHVGIALENKKIIHASGKVRIDGLANEGIKHIKSGQLTHRLHSIKRIY